MKKSCSNKSPVYIVAYWYDYRFKKKSGGLIRLFEIGNILSDFGYNAVLILPKLGHPKTQTVAKTIEIPFIDFSIFRPISFHFLSTLILCIKLINERGPIYVRQMNSFIPLMFAKLFDVRSFFEIPNDPYLSYESKKYIRKIIEKTIDKLSITFSDRVVVLSEWSKKRLIKFGHVPASKILVLPSGTDINLFRPMDKRICRQAVGLENSFFYVGFIGSFLAHQGIDTLIGGAVSILRKHISVRFLLVGDGPMKKVWQDMVHCRGMDAAFIFTGHIPYKNIPAYIGSMDICTAPHKKDSNQASPVKIFDYMSCARPVIASNIEAVREIAGESGGALLIPPDNPEAFAKAVESLVLDVNKLEIMGTRGREYAVCHFDRKQIIKTLQYSGIIT